MRLPAQSKPLPWYERSEMRQWLEKLFLMSSYRRGYRVILGTGERVAYVDYQKKQFFINREVPVPNPSFMVRFKPTTEREQRNLALKALTVHEAAHVAETRLSVPLSEPERLLWNAIEDERIERLAARRFPEMSSAFTYLGDTFCSSKVGQFSHSAREGVLFWRFAHDHPTAFWQVKPEEAQLWEEVRPLIEAGWNVQSSNQVAWIAQCIEWLFNPKEQPPESGESDPDAPRGKGQSEAQQADATATDPQSGEAGQEAEGEAEGDEAGEAGQPSESESGEQSDSESSSGEGQPSEGQPSEQGDSESALQPSEADSPAPSPDELTQYADMLSDSGEDPGDSAEADLEAEMALTDLPGGKGATLNELPEPPESPEADHTEGQELALRVEHYARAIAPILKPREQPALPLAHKSRGRFNYARYAAGEEKYFDHKTIPHHPKEITVTLLLDTSGSMKNDLPAAKDIALMLRRAGLLSNTRSRLLTFSDIPTELCPPEMPYPEAAARIAKVKANGGTHLTPALSKAVTQPTSPDELSFVVIISDGQLDGLDAQRCKEIVQAFPQIRYLPLLIGSATSSATQWASIFGSAKAFDSLESITPYIKSVLTTQRAKNR